MNKPDNNTGSVGENVDLSTINPDSLIYLTFTKAIQAMGEDLNKWKSYIRLLESFLKAKGYVDHEYDKKIGDYEDTLKKENLLKNEREFEITVLKSELLFEALVKNKISTEMLQF